MGGEGDISRSGSDASQSGGTNSDLNFGRVADELVVAQQNTKDPPFLPRYDYFQNVLRSDFEEGLNRVQQIPASENPANMIRPGDTLKVVKPDGRTEYFEVLANGTVKNGRTPMSLQLLLQSNRGATIFRLPPKATG